MQRMTHAVTIDHLRAAADYFWQRVDIAGVEECWNWIQAPTSQGYGSFALPVRLSPTGTNLRVGAHRVAWALRNGRLVDPDLTIDHLCRNRRCVNPDHLEEVTLAVNNERGACRPYKHGFQRAQPKRHEGRYGVVVWRLRWRDYSSGEPVLRQRSFPTEADALSFRDANSWWS